MTISFNPSRQAVLDASPDDALNQLGTSRNGLAQEEVKDGSAFGANLLKPKGRTDTVLSWSISSEALRFILISPPYWLFSGRPDNGSIILPLLWLAGLLGFWQERGSTMAVQKLMAIVQFESLCSARTECLLRSLWRYCSGRHRFTRSRRCYPCGLSDHGIEGSIRGRGHSHRRNLPGGKISRNITRGNSCGHRTNSLFMETCYQRNAQAW